jgi:hypothetical protein
MPLLSAAAQVFLIFGNDFERSLEFTHFYSQAKKFLWNISRASLRDGQAIYFSNLV